MASGPGAFRLSPQRHRRALGQQRAGHPPETRRPYAFRDRLAIPKYIVNATNDSVFLPDGSQNYLADLPGEKLLRYRQRRSVLNGSDWLEGVAAYVSTCVAVAIVPASHGSLSATIRFASRQRVPRHRFCSGFRPKHHRP